MRPRKLTAEQHQELAARCLLYVRHRVAAAQHSPYAIAKDLGISKETVRAYLNRPIARQG
jgi:DNA-binding CsgD family transcriptional regulator